MNRRNFIKKSSLATAALWVPSFLKPLQGFSLPENRNLVVVQLSGGNDGLNTVIPFENDLYYNNRKTIAIAKEKILRLGDDVGFNPAMKAMHNLYQDGMMCIINNVGYPNPDRSHFRSMDIWQSASSSSEYKSSGWIGRYLDATCDTGEKPYYAIELDQTLSLALKGEKYKGIAVNNEKQLYNETREPFFRQIKDLGVTGSDNVSYLYKTMADTYASAEYLYESTKLKSNSFEYPKNSLAGQLKKVAGFIAADLETNVYYVSMGGFDTHIAQVDKQARLLEQVSDSIDAFVQNLKKVDRLQDTCILVFSEFGRRVAQNASNGTDHGTANNIFVIGSGLKKTGLYNALPDLSDLDQGDLKYRVDFREIYSTLLSNWLKADSSKILGGNFNTLNFI